MLQECLAQRVNGNLEQKTGLKVLRHGLLRCCSDRDFREQLCVI
jgi:hypothetical protein